MDDDFPIDDAEFWDGPEGDEAKPTYTLGVAPSQLLAELERIFGREEAVPPAPELVWHKPLLTPEEFMALHGLKKEA